MNIRRFLFSLEERGGAKATIYTHQKELRAFFNFVHSEGLIEEDPMESIKQVKLPKLYPYVLSEEDVVSLLKVAKGNTFEQKRNRAILILLVDTGLRSAEVASATVDDINLAAYSLKVRGKGEKERTVMFGRKTARAIRSYVRTRG